MPRNLLRSMLFFVLLLPGLLLFVLCGCASPVVKPAAFDPAVLVQHPLPADLLHKAPRGERVVQLGPKWMAVDATRNQVFAGYRPGPGQLRYCQVLRCDPDQDRLVLRPLPDDMTPLDVLREGLGDSPDDGQDIILSLRQVVRDRLLGPPLPQPRRIYAAAANLPSHLRYDLALDEPEAPKELRKARARLFKKHPPTPAPGTNGDRVAPFRGVIGPFDDIEYPARIALPPEAASESNATDKTNDKVHTYLDYEVEVGAVLGTALDWEQVQALTDDQLMAAVSGYVLFSDVKARNPQMFWKALTRDDPPPNEHNPYMTGLGWLDRAYGSWDRTICAWWSHAAGWGNYTALGPFFVAAPDDHALPSRAVLTARTYATAGVRGHPVPTGRMADTFYLRQCSRITDHGDHPDQIIWGIPQMIRSLLAPDSAAVPESAPHRLEPGDIISLGTPGGAVITARSQRFYDFVDVLLFWWSSRDWHDVFFGKDKNLYLHHGDQVFFWAQGLGCQRHDVVRR